MKQILQILQEAAEGAEQPAPSLVFGAQAPSNDRLSRRLRLALSQTCSEVITQAPRPWSSLESTWVFQLQQGVASYPLPPDYLSLIQNTDHRGAHTLGMCGPTTADLFSYWRHGQRVPPSNYGFRVRMGRLYIEPVPAMAETVTFDYISRFPAMQTIAGWGSALWDGAPGDHAKAPFVTREGHLAVKAGDLSMSSEAFNAEYRLLTPPAGWDASNDTDGDGYVDALVRKPTFDRDTDLCALDEALVLAGVIWRMRRAYGMPYAEERRDFVALFGALAAHDHGGMETFEPGGEDRRPGYALYDPTHGPFEL